jgi:N-acetylneuraminic acid mutarotase
VDDAPYLFSFGGIDKTKKYSGIHLRSFRTNLETLKSERIPDLPDTLGKIAAGASRIGNIIYIIGGYHVFADGSELSSKKIHRYDIKDNIFLSDGANIPVPIDDQVQVVWQDKLIYVIAGWSNTGNVPNVQIYDPDTDSWSVGTPLPNTDTYKSFGAAGTIIGNIIFYFGGAGSSFSPQNTLRKGVIEPNNPTQISWSVSIPEPNIFGYRMASTTVQNRPLWIGGSQNTYNFNGIAYDRSGGVSTSNRILHNTSPHIESEFNQIFLEQIPMDLRGIANLGDGKLYIAGGMIDNQKVTDKIYEIIINTF